MQRTLETTLLAAALCLTAASLTAAQAAECEQDSDCGEGMRCEAGLVLAGCPEPPCEDAAQPPASHCVDAMLGEACSADADCGGELTCARTVVSTNCTEGEPDCMDQLTGEGYCAEAASLAATSGLAPGAPEPASAGAAGGSADMGAPESDAPSTSGGSSSCSIGGDTGGMTGWAPVMLALALLGLRRRRSAPAA